MKATILITFFFLSMQAHSQYVRKNDVTNMIANALKPLQTTITNLTARLAIAESKNTADSLFKIQQATINAGVKTTMDTAMVQPDGYFLISGKILTINLKTLAPQIKTYLGGKL